MDPQHKILLRRFHKKIVDDVVALDILPDLIQDGVLDLDDGETIARIRSPRGQIRRLLFMLPCRGSNAFKSFVSALRENYSWLAEQLDPTEEGGEDEVDAEPSYTDLNDMDVNEEVVNLLRKNPGVMKRWSSLAHALEMTTAKTQIQIQANIFMWDLDQCVVTLMEKWKAEKGKYATVGALMKVLRKESFNDVADELEDKYTHV